MGARLYDTHKIVEELLYQYPDTRNSDALLCLMVFKTIRPESAKMPLEKVLLEGKELGLPNFGTITRHRRKLQAENEELRACDKVTDYRYENYKEFKKYALEV